MSFVQRLGSIKEYLVGNQAPNKSTHGDYALKYTDADTSCLIERPDAAGALTHKTGRLTVSYAPTTQRISATVRGDIPTLVFLVGNKKGKSRADVDKKNPFVSDGVFDEGQEFYVLGDDAAALLYDLGQAPEYARKRKLESLESELTKIDGQLTNIDSELEGLTEQKKKVQSVPERYADSNYANLVEEKQAELKKEFAKELGPLNKKDAELKGEYDRETDPREQKRILEDRKKTKADIDGLKPKYETLLDNIPKKIAEERKAAEAEYRDKIGAIKGREEEKETQKRNLSVQRTKHLREKNDLLSSEAPRYDTKEIKKTIGETLRNKEIRTIDDKIKNVNTYLRSEVVKRLIESRGEGTPKEYHEGRSIDAYCYTLEPVKRKVGILPIVGAGVVGLLAGLSVLLTPLRRGPVTYEGASPDSVAKLKSKWEETLRKEYEGWITPDSAAKLIGRINDLSLQNTARADTISNLSGVIRDLREGLAQPAKVETARVVGHVDTLAPYLKRAQEELAREREARRRAEAARGKPRVVVREKKVYVPVPTEPPKEEKPEKVGGVEWYNIGEEKNPADRIRSDERKSR